MDKDAALKLGLQLIATAEYLATDAEICGKDAKEERALIQRSKIAFEEALAQPEQEPDDLTIAYMSGFHAGKNTPQRKLEQEPVCVAFIRTCVGKDKDGIEIWKEEPLYTTSPQRTWVGLTEPEVDEAYKSVSNKEWAIGGLDDARVFFCAIEAKLREKNT